MVVKKICMMGAFAVGKTSLVRRFVHSIFTDQYQTTIGVMISKKSLTVDDAEYQLVIWDLEGRDEFTDVRSNYLRGAAGALFVVDVTRPHTLIAACQLRDEMRRHVGDIPSLILLNKSDLADQWRLDGDVLQQLEKEGCQMMRTSARNGDQVDASFEALVRAMQPTGVE